MVVRERGGGLLLPSSFSYDDLLLEIQQCIVNINDLRDKKQSIRGEVSRLNSLIKELAVNEGI